jgi:RHS repeat-associated protein
VKRSTGFNTTYFGYDEGINPQLQMDTQSGNQITHRYLWSDQVDELFADEQRLSGLVPDTKWALSDHQGTIKDIADFNSTTGQTAVRHRAYDSFGNRKGSALTTDIVFGYTGKYFDETTGLQNSWNRWYSPKMGRFISQDPIRFAAGDANLYRYVGNSSPNATDPSGLVQDPTDKETIDLPNVVGQVDGKRGIKVVPHSPLLGSLDKQLGTEYYSRAITGCFVLPRFSRNRVAIFRDDGFVAGQTITQRGDFLVDYAIGKGIPADGKFHTVHVPEWTNIYSVVDRVGLGDFWISTPHSLDTYGSYEIRMEGKVTTGVGTVQNATVRGIGLVWRLTDRVDANSVFEFKWRGGGWKQVAAGCLEVTVGDIVGDKLMGGSYDLEVYFAQREEDERQASGQPRE